MATSTRPMRLLSPAALRGGRADDLSEARRREVAQRHGLTAGMMTICGAADHITNACTSAATNSRPVATASHFVQLASRLVPWSAFVVNVSIFWPRRFAL